MSAARATQGLHGDHPCQSHLSLVAGAAVGASQPPGRLEKALVGLLVLGVAWGLILGLAYALMLLLSLL